VRQEVGELIRAEQPRNEPQSNVLTVTGLLPDSISTDEPAASSHPDQDGALSPNTLPDGDTSVTANQELLDQTIASSEVIEADDIVTNLLRRARYLLTLKGRPPFCLAGTETYQRLQELVDLTTELLAHRHHPHLARLSQGIQNALQQFSNDYQELQLGIDWLKNIDDSVGFVLGSCHQGPEVSEPVLPNRSRIAHGIKVLVKATVCVCSIIKSNVWVLCIIARGDVRDDSRIQNPGSMPLFRQHGGYLIMAEKELRGQRCSFVRISLSQCQFRGQGESRCSPVVDVEEVLVQFILSEIINRLQLGGGLIKVTVCKPFLTQE